MHKLLTAFLCLVFFNLSAQQNRNTISGYIKETGSGESLTGVNIYIPSLKTGAVTNTYGFYSLTVQSSDTVELFFSYIGYRTETKKIVPAGNIELNIELQPNLLLGEVTITAETSERPSQSVQMSNIRVQLSQVKNLPALLGEKDILKVLQLMPGVQKGMEGSSGMYVRGGGPDQNLIILDDAIVYNASHLFGFFSLFNGDALKSVELIKGGFPARYGGRLSSVIDINMKDGNKEEWHGDAGIGLISSRLMIEGPIKKDKSSILISGRRTYADLMLKPIIKASGENTGYYFYDLNAKVNYDFGRNNKIYLSSYFGRDRFYLKSNDQEITDDVGFNWSNATATLRWNHLFNSRLFSNTSFVFSNYTFKIYDKYKYPAEQKDYYAEYHSGISDFTLKFDLDFIPNPRHIIKAGLITISHNFTPYAYVELDQLNRVDFSDTRRTVSQESGLYLEDTWQPFEKLRINGGMRFSHFIAGGRNYFFPEPRLSTAFRFKKDLAVKASYSEMNQFIHLLSNSGVNLPTDLWVPATDKVEPQHSRQLAAGIVKDFLNQAFSVSTEVYYKRMNNVIGYKEGATFMQLNDASSSSEISWEDNVTSGDAWSYGAEFLLQKKTGKLTGWIGYTLSKTEMQLDSVNFGRKFYARYDRRHDISLVAVYEISERITLSGTWVYGSGAAVTLPFSEYEITPHNQVKDPFRPQMGSHPVSVLNYGERNNFRMGSYHRMDAGIQFRKQKKRYERIWEISVYNLYNRRNPFFYYSAEKTDDNKTYGVLKQISLFPVLPSFTYSIKF